MNSTTAAGSSAPDQKSTTLPSAIVTRRSMRRAEFVVVGGDQRGQTGLAHQRFQGVKDIARRFRIQIAGRLVGQKQARCIGDGAGNRHALLFATGKLRRAMRAAMADPHVVQQLTSARSFASLRGKPAIICGIMMFSMRREFRQQVVKLIDEADFAAADRGALVIRQDHRRHGR